MTDEESGWNNFHIDGVKVKKVKHEIEQQQRQPAYGKAQAHRFQKIATPQKALSIMHNKIAIVIIIIIINIILITGGVVVGVIACTEGFVLDGCVGRGDLLLGLDFFY